MRACIRSNPVAQAATSSGVGDSFRCRGPCPAAMDATMREHLSGRNVCNESLPNYIMVLTAAVMLRKACRVASAALDFLSAPVRNRERGVRKGGGTGGQARGCASSVPERAGSTRSGKARVSCQKHDALFAQGAPADAVFYILEGRVKLTVAARQGKEAVVAILGPGDFVGEGCLAGQLVRMAALPRQRGEFSERFTAVKSGSKRTLSTSSSTPARSCSRGRSCCWRRSVSSHCHRTGSRALGPTRGVSIPSRW
jgi:hypothetical protein